MSYRTYRQIWCEAQKTLDYVVEIDTCLQTAKPQRDKEEAFKGKLKF